MVQLRTVHVVSSVDDLIALFGRYQPGLPMRYGHHVEFGQWSGSCRRVSPGVQSQDAQPASLEGEPDPIVRRTSGSGQ